MQHAGRGAARGVGQCCSNKSFPCEALAVAHNELMKLVQRVCVSVELGWVGACKLIESGQQLICFVTKAVKLLPTCHTHTLTHTRTLSARERKEKHFNIFCTAIICALVSLSCSLKPITLSALLKFQLKATAITTTATTTATITTTLLHTLNWKLPEQKAKASQAK